MSDTADIKMLLATNKRQLQLLDKELALLERLVANDEAHQAFDSDSPYFYGAVGDDNQNGVLVDRRRSADTFTGRVVVQSDAPFVWTHLATALALTPIVGAPFPHAGVWSPAGGANNSIPNFSFGFVEEGSGRVLFQSEAINPATGANDVGQLFSGSLINTAGLFSASAGGFYTEQPGGNGPNYVFPLVERTILPANDVITVKVSPSRRLPTLADARVFVTLIGYKIFED